MYFRSSFLCWKLSDHPLFLQKTQPSSAPTVGPNFRLPSSITSSAIQIYPWSSATKPCFMSPTPGFRPSLSTIGAWRPVSLLKIIGSFGDSPFIEAPTCVKQRSRYLCIFHSLVVFEPDFWSQKNESPSKSYGL